MIIRKAIVICIALSCAILAVLPACSVAAVTQETAKAAAFKRSCQLAKAVFNDIQNLPTLKLGTKVEDLPSQIRAKLEDMMESEMAAAEKPFDPVSFTKATIEAYISKSGQKHLEVTLSNERHIWIIAPERPVSNDNNSTQTSK